MTSTYQPPTIVDLRLSYDFGEGTLLPLPGWAEKARVSFTVNNLNDAFGESTTVAGGVEEVRVSAGSPQFGRVFNLTVHMSL